MDNLKNSSSANDLNIEKCRLRTFNDHWPHAYISPNILAKIGFFYIGPYDNVRCHFCKIEVSCWEMGDNEVAEHERWSTNCPLLKQLQTNNIPLEPVSDLNKLLASIKNFNRQITVYEETPYIYFNSPKFQGHPKAINIELMVERITGLIAQQCAQFPELREESDRLKTFEGWPKSIKQTPKQLSEAGFFFTQKEDRVICFSCGGGLYKWEKADDPWEQHALLYEHCYFLNITKGIDFMSLIRNNYKQ